MKNRSSPSTAPGAILLLLLFLTSLAILSACSAADSQKLLQAVEELDSPIFSIEQDGTPSPKSTPVEPATEEEHLTQTELDEEQFLLIEEIIIGMLFVAVLVGIVAHRLRVPYTVGLVLIGLVLALRSPIEVNISPNLILALLVPPLIFEAAFHLNFNDLRNNLAPILALAVPGVILTTFIVGGIVAWGTGLVLPVALVFGALVSATDPVSVVSLFRAMGVPKRLQVLLEGESLFNDGTAIVLFDLVVTVAITGAANFNLLFSLIDFIRVAGGGLVVGILLGTVVSQLISRIDDYLIETTLTSVLAYGAYLIAEVLGVSGVLAVVAAGLVNGNIGPRGMSPTTRIVVFNFWEYAAFLANSFIFLLIGLQIELTILFENWELILWAILAILVARAIGVYGLSWIEREIPTKWKHILYWGGLRGAISLALALSLPDKLPQVSDQIQVMAFGVVLFTLLVPGFSMKPLVRLLGLIERSEAQEEYERRHARAVANRAAYEHLERRHNQGLLSEHSWKLVKPLLDEYNRTLVDAVREVMTTDPTVEAEELDTARREALRAQRSAISSLLKDGVISEETYSQLITEVDAAITRPQTGWPELVATQSVRRPVKWLMAVVIQEQDVENALSALTKLGISVTSLPSSGGFLGQRSVTMLIGLAEGQEEATIKAIHRSCLQRVEYLTTPTHGFPSVLATPTPIKVGGATIFAFEVERFEIF
ncbi:MAG TPA: Na+/H+ antiporter [Anaerolineales bacterium]|nr:Na+/H+ antiporter [Anaerolineales bacterium]